MAWAAPSAERPSRFLPTVADYQRDKRDLPDDKSKIEIKQRDVSDR